MLTTDGKRYIKRYMAGQVSQIGRAISFGIGDTAAALGDVRLQFEIGRSRIKSVSYDFNADKLIFKANLPENLAGKIYEIGLWSTDINVLAGPSADRTILIMDSETEVWNATPTWSTTNTRQGIDSLRQAPGAGLTVTNTIVTDLNLSAYSGSDIFAVAYYNLNANTDFINIRFKTDASNYYTMNINDPATAYRVSTMTKASLAITGSPSWASITSIDVETKANTAVTAQVDFDGLILQDADTANPDYVLVSREVISPFTIVAGSVNEVEFSLAVSV